MADQTTSRKITDRIRKLLGLSRSSNPNESAAASELAASLMKEHGLSEADVTEDVKDGSEIIDVPVGSDGFRATWRFALMTSIARAHDCEAIGLRVGERRKVRVVGRRRDVALVVRVFSIVTPQIEKFAVMFIVGDSAARPSWDDWTASEQDVSQAVRRESFKQGAATGIAEQLVERRRRQRQQETPSYGSASGAAFVVRLDGLVTYRGSRAEVHDYLRSKFGGGAPASASSPSNGEPGQGAGPVRVPLEGAGFRRVEDDATSLAPEDFLKGLEVGRMIQLPIDEKHEAK